MERVKKSPRAMERGSGNNGKYSTIARVAFGIVAVITIGIVGNMTVNLFFHGVRAALQAMGWPVC